MDQGWKRAKAGDTLPACDYVLVQEEEKRTGDMFAFFFIDLNIAA